ncbi:MAG: hypothetical protein U5N86_13460 [Planctomycetota bacterium]|nr:hypothetical protein [Planctomycetota bacterium]
MSPTGKLSENHELAGKLKAVKVAFRTPTAWKIYIRPFVISAGSAHKLIWNKTNYFEIVEFLCIQEIGAMDKRVLFQEWVYQLGQNSVGVSQWKGVTRAERRTAVE